MGDDAERDALPIVYVRGWAGTGSKDIEKAVDDPFYGFNDGSVLVRAGVSGRPDFYQFEGPLLRLITHHDYKVPLHGNQRSYLADPNAGKASPASIWIHRFYDVSAADLIEKPEAFSIENAAQDLFDLIKGVLEKTGAPKVFLVAHSMGGLICRAMMQRTIPEANGPRNAEDFVERFFTYATPHGGIKFAVGSGLLEHIRDATGIFGADIFGPDRMYQYLTPGKNPGDKAPYDFDPLRMEGYPLERVFCLVGSDASDYDGVVGLSQVVGARSDGLVQIENAAVKGAHRAIVHRSHSGPYGIVNSEEGYQNLKRFLFGDHEVNVQLENLNIGDGRADAEFQLDVAVAIRGLVPLVHEQTAAHYCPVLIQQLDGEDSIDTPVPLMATFLSSSAPRPLLNAHTGEQAPNMRFSLNLRLFSISQNESFFSSDHLAQTADWEDTLLVDVAPATDLTGPKVWAEWNSSVQTTVRDWNTKTNLPDADGLSLENDGSGAGPWSFSILLPRTAFTLMGANSTINLTVTRRTLSFQTRPTAAGAQF